MPIAMNIGVKEIRGDIIMYLGAYSVYSYYSSDYIEKLVLWMRKSEADSMVWGVYFQG